MQLLNLTLPSSAENLALDEALIESAECDSQAANCLRLWEPTKLVVIVGRSSKVDQEVNLEACRDHEVPIYRRCSGGASIVTGAGCLMYSILLSYQTYPQLRMIQQSHQFILGAIADGLITAIKSSEQLQQDEIGNNLQPVVQQGTSDLTWQGRKFSGNSLRCKQNHLLYHGTLLYDFPIEKIEQLLLVPPRLPEYRKHRSHSQFITNLPLPKEKIQDSLIASFDANEVMNQWPQELTEQLVTSRYQNQSWNRKY